MIAALPRVFALTDDRVIAEGGVAERAAAMAEAGGVQLAVGLRSTKLTDRELLLLAERLSSHLKAHHSHLAISGRADIARAAGASIVLAGRGALAISDLRKVAPNATIMASVHDASEVRSDADALLAGAIFEKHGAPLAGLPLLEAAAKTGKPVIAVGGVTPENAAAAAGAGAWGVAAIRALWDAADPGAAVRGFLAALPRDTSIAVTINGAPKRARAGSTLETLLADLSLDPRAVVVERNREIVRREMLAETAVMEGDSLELVHFVGGG